MYKFIRFYNQNRKAIYIFILIIVFLYAMLRLLNNAIKEKNMNYNTNSINNNLTIGQADIVSNEIEKNTNTQIQDDKSTENNISSPKKTIKEFIDYCNDNKIEKAYNLLSDDCKEELFQTMEIFKEQYYDVIFNNQLKMCDIEHWGQDTYKVDLYNDALSTGNIDVESTDYVTCVKQNDEYKLNIKNYVGRKSIKKEVENKNIKIKVLEKNTYMDYEYYNIQVTNNSENDILLDPKIDTKTTYLQNSKGAKFYAFTNEIIDNEFIVRKDKTKNIKIKFSNDFSTYGKIKSLVFSNLILNYKEYENMENKGDYKDIYEFVINI